MDSSIRMLCYLFYIILSMIGYPGTIASPFNPHVLPSSNSTKPYFEGWFARVIDHDSNRSFAVIVGSFQHAHSVGFTQNWLALLFQRGDDMQTVQLFPDNVIITEHDQNVTKDPDLTSPSSFTYVLPGFGSLSVRDDTAKLNFTFPENFTVQANLQNRIPWNRDIPNGDGPEGWLEHFNLLPCHYYVQSLGSLASYNVTDLRTKEHFIGDGFGHMEANYGQNFPVAWAWAEGVSRKRNAQFLITTGRFVVAGITTTTTVIAYRSLLSNWTFRSTDLDEFNIIMGSCNGTLVLNATNLLKSKKLVMTISTNISSFSDSLYFPTPNGFSNDPGCEESYSARALIDLYVENTLYESALFDLSALEFGGQYKCKRN